LRELDAWLHGGGGRRRGGSARLKEIKKAHLRPSSTEEKSQNFHGRGGGKAFVSLS